MKTSRVNAGWKFSKLTVNYLKLIINLKFRSSKAKPVSQHQEFDSGWLAIICKVKLIVCYHFHSFRVRSVGYLKLSHFFFFLVNSVEPGLIMVCKFREFTHEILQTTWNILVWIRKYSNKIQMYLEYNFLRNKIIHLFVIIIKLYEWQL